MVQENLASSRVLASKFRRILVMGFRRTLSSKFRRTFGIKVRCTLVLGFRRTLLHGLGEPGIKVRCALVVVEVCFHFSQLFVKYILLFSVILGFLFSLLSTKSAVVISSTAFSANGSCSGFVFALTFSVECSVSACYASSFVFQLFFCWNIIRWMSTSFSFIFFFTVIVIS